MNEHGVWLASRFALAIVLVVVGSLFRALAMPGRNRDRLFGAGSVGGILTGVGLAYPLSRWLETDVSAIGAVVGMCLGWGVAMLFARAAASDGPE
jgi:hypothetical protein